MQFQSKLNGVPHLVALMGIYFLSQVLLPLLSLIVDYGVEFELHVLRVVGFCTRSKNLWDAIRCPALGLFSDIPTRKKTSTIMGWSFLIIH